MPIELIVVGCIYIYKLCLSPVFGGHCAYMPTCSTYVLQCIVSFGLIRGGVYGARRLCRCCPRSKGGYDFVPLNIKGDFKWVS